MVSGALILNARRSLVTKLLAQKNTSKFRVPFLINKKMGKMMDLQKCQSNRENRT